MLGIPFDGNHERLVASFLTAAAVEGSASGVVWDDVLASKYSPTRHRLGSCGACQIAADRSIHMPAETDRWEDGRT